MHAQCIRYTKPTYRTKAEENSASAIIRAVIEKNSHRNIIPMLQYVIGTLFGNDIRNDLLYDTKDHDIEIKELVIDIAWTVAIWYDSKSC